MGHCMIFLADNLILHLMDFTVVTLRIENMLLTTVLIFRTYSDRGSSIRNSKFKLKENVYANKHRLKNKFKLKENDLQTYSFKLSNKHSCSSSRGMISNYGGRLKWHYYGLRKEKGEKPNWKSN
jgi:hypothetical protein